MYVCNVQGVLLLAVVDCEHWQRAAKIAVGRDGNLEEAMEVYGYFLQKIQLRFSKIENDYFQARPRVGNRCR